MAKTAKQTVEGLIKKGVIVPRWVDIDEVKENPKNPRTIDDAEMAALKKSISDFPEMMLIRPIVVDENMVALGGNQRKRGCRELGWPKVPVIDAKSLTAEQQKEFIIKDNLPFGKWDNKELREGWDVPLLEVWGMDVSALVKAATVEGEMKFSPELDRESNYIVLKFNKDIDFLQVQTMLGLEQVYSKRRNGKPWAAGVGRVLDGVTVIERLKTIKK